MYFYFVTCRVVEAVSPAVAASQASGDRDGAANVDLGALRLALERVRDKGARLVTVQQAASLMPDTAVEAGDMHTYAVVKLDRYLNALDAAYQLREDERQAMVADLHKVRFHVCVCVCVCVCV